MYFKYRCTQKIKSKSKKEIYYAKTNKNKTKVTALISDKIDFRAKNIKDKESYFVKVSND